MKHFRVTNLTMTIMLGGLTQLVGCGSNNPAASCPGVALDAGGLDAADLDAESLDPPSNGVPDTPPIDYSNQASWRRLGDWTGSIDPTPIASVDVFFLYPTTFFPGPKSPNHTCPTDPNNKPSRWNQTLREAQMDPGIEAQVYSKAGVFFEEAGKTNLYVPFYRQVAGNYYLPAVLWKQNPENEPDANDALKIAYNDVLSAFTYYLHRYNNGHRFILAGHSQGSNLLVMLLKDALFSNPAVRDKLVAAYVIGWSVTSADMDVIWKQNQISICAGNDQTKCIVTYNTQQDPGDFSQAKYYPQWCSTVGSPPTGLVQKDAYSVNPLSWKANGPSTPAMPGIQSETGDAEPATKNLGALFFRLNDVKPYWGLGPAEDNTKYICQLRPQLGPFTPQSSCDETCPNCPGPSSYVQAVTGVVVPPKWVLGTIANQRVWFYEIPASDGYTGAQNNKGALVIDPNQLKAPGNYQNLNPPYNTSDADNNILDPFDAKNQPPGWYHNYDYSFFWRNLERNAKDRITAGMPSN